MSEMPADRRVRQVVEARLSVRTRGQSPQKSWFQLSEEEQAILAAEAKEFIAMFDASMLPW